MTTSLPRTTTKAGRPSFTCTECGAPAAKWVGRCAQCQAWGSLAEVGAPGRTLLRRVSAGPVTRPAQPIADIDASPAVAVPTGVPEFDRVLGGGLVRGGVILLAGEPGVGKSTLLLAAAASWAAHAGGTALVVTGEESVEQVKVRADRMGALHPRVFLAAETELSAVLGHIEAVRPSLLVLDSVQTVSTDQVDGSAGGVTQVRAVAAALTAVARERGMACVLVGHVTKDGAIAGPRVLEHLVDVVLHFEGDQHSSLRMIRGVKNRFGPSDEIGCFKMVADGLHGLADPAEVFLTRRRASLPGTCAAVTLSGRRPLPVEIQALVTQASSEVGRRTLSGLDSSRAAIVLAVLQRWGGVDLGRREVLAGTVGGVRVSEPAIDLPLALALWSSARDIPLEPGLAAVGEIGLSAEIRPVAAVERRVVEAARLGFDRLLIPAGSGVRRPNGVRIDEVADLGAALRSVGTDEGVASWLRLKAAHSRR